MNVWEYLGIEPTNDVKIIKLAYAKLLKIYRPEVDQEGFINLRSAYEFAMECAKNYYEDEENTPLDSSESCSNAEKPDAKPSSIAETQVEQRLLTNENVQVQTNDEFDEYEMADKIFSEINNLLWNKNDRNVKKNWENILEQAQMWNFQVKELVSEHLIELFAKHEPEDLPFKLSSEIWTTLSNFFNWKEDEQKLYKHYPAIVVDRLLHHIRNANDNVIIPELKRSVKSPIPMEDGNLHNVKNENSDEDWMLYKMCMDFAKYSKSNAACYLSLLMGGISGAHYFYLGRIKSGLAMFFVFIFWNSNWVLSPFLRNDIAMDILGLMFGFVIAEFFLVKGRVEEYNAWLFETIKKDYLSFESLQFSYCKIFCVITIVLSCVFYYGSDAIVKRMIFLNGKKPVTSMQLESPASKKSIKIYKNKLYQASVDEAKWKPQPPKEKQSFFTWKHVGNSVEIYLLTFAKNVTLDKIKSAILRDFKAMGAEHIIITKALQKTINGKKVLQVDASLKFDNVGYIVRSYNWNCGNEEVELYSVFPEKIFDEYVKEMDEFANSLEIK